MPSVTSICSKPYHLILVRHSQPEITQGVPACEWRLSAEGRARCQPLAEEIAQRYAPVAIVSSDEPKAIETAALIARPLGLTAELRPDLREHEREAGPLLDARAFQAAIADLFARPEELVYGRETATQALARFSRAIGMVLAEHPVGDVVVVSHGTVMSLYLAATAGSDGYAVWRSLRLPDMRAVTRTDQPS